MLRIASGSPLSTAKFLAYSLKLEGKNIFSNDSNEISCKVPRSCQIASTALPSTNEIKKLVANVKNREAKERLD